MPSYKSFRSRLLSRVFPLVLLILVIEAVSSAYFISKYAYDELDQRVNLIGQDPRRIHYLATALNTQSIFMLENAASATLSIPEVAYFGVHNHADEVVYEDVSAVHDAHKSLIREFPIYLLSTGLSASAGDAIDDQEKIFLGTLVIGYSTQFAEVRARTEFMYRLVIAAFFLVLISAAVDYSFRTSIGQHLLHLARAMRRASDADTKVDSKDEIGQLVQQYNQMVHQQNYLLNAAQKISSSGSWDMDVQSGDMVWSRQLYEIFSVSADVIRPNLEMLIDFAHPDDRMLIRQAVAATLSRRQDINQEIRITRADGQERVVYFQTHCLASQHGDISRIIGNITDITDRKREDTERLQAMKLHALGSLSSGMAHSLNNLILPILISSRMVLKNLSKTGSHDDRERLNRVIMAAERASELIAKVLAFSHREEPGFSRINFSDVVRNALRLIQVTSPATVKIESSIFNDPVMIVGDAAKLETIILDLASNAFASMEGVNGRLAIATRLQDVVQDIPGFPVNVLPGHYVVLEVEDTGVGMDAIVMKRIFEPFFTTKSNGMGTGLGLANVEGTVSTHNGYMQVRSTPGVGTAFTLYFPIDQESRNHEKNTDY